MLDYFGVFTKGGALLWTLQLTTALKHNPVEALNALIRTCLLEERSGESTFTYTPKAGAAQTLKWTFHNGLGLVFVAVYQKALSLLYVEELLTLVKEDFTAAYQPSRYEYPDFEDSFRRRLRECEARADEAKRGAQVAARGGIQPVVKGARKQGGQEHTVKQTGLVQAANGKAGAAGGQVSTAAGGGTAAAASSDGGSGEAEDDDSGDNEDNRAFDTSKLKSTGARGGRGARGRGRSFKESAKKPEEKKDGATTKKKTMRNWNNVAGAADTSDTVLDYSQQKADGDEPLPAGGIPAGRMGGAADGGAVGAVVGKSRMDEEEVFDSEEDEDDEQEEDGSEGEAANGPTPRAAAPGAPAPQRRGLLGSFINNLTMSVAGKGALTAADISPALGDMKRKLMERNVAEPIAQQICDSVASSLEGKKLSSFTGVSSFVRAAFEDALNGILNKRAIDVLLDVQRARARGKPYTIVFCGVNGVGKSTNLAKIAYWLLQHGISVIIAACDTFRAGAVEQLKTHCARLQVPLYERGYEKDPAKVAGEAIKQAERDGIDVVLVDTAGRMQDNEPLMRALSSLINVNQPNLVLFVGEALVGNDAVDQLVKFNRALHDLAPKTAVTRHTIDGIVLTKFDTIDDKVGAALSMVYSSGAPVMFVGCGQTYVDLKKLNVKSVVKSLLK